MPRKKKEKLEVTGGYENKNSPPSTSLPPLKAPENLMITQEKYIPDQSSREYTQPHEIFKLFLEKENKSSHSNSITRGLIPVSSEGDGRFTVLLDISINWGNKTIHVHQRARQPNGRAREIWLSECGKDFSKVFRRQ